MTNERLFDTQESDFSLLQRVQTESGKHPAWLFGGYSVTFIQI